MKLLLAAVLTALSLSACVIAPPDAAHGTYPTTYQQTIPQHMAARLAHPEGALYRFLDPEKIWSSPLFHVEADWAGYQVLFYVNARDARGIYTGDQEWSATIRNDVIIKLEPYVEPYVP